MAKKIKTRKGKDGFDYPYTSPDIVIDENGKSATKKFEEVNAQFKDIAKQTITTEERNKLTSLNNYDDTSIKSDIQTQKARIDTFTSLKEGSTTGDAELIDARVGVDGIVYDNLGDAIREIQKPMILKYGNLLNLLTCVNGFINSDGNISDNSSYKVTNYIKVNAGKKVYFSQNGNYKPMQRVAFYDKNKTFLSVSNDWVNNVDISSECAYIRINIAVDTYNEGKLQVEYDKVTPYKPYNPYSYKLNGEYIENHNFVSTDDIIRTMKYPFIYSATLIRPSYNTVPCKNLAIKELYVEVSTYEKYYIKEIYKFGQGYCCVKITNESESESFSYKETISSPQNGIKMHNLLNNDGEIKGYIVIDWDGVTNADGVGLNYESHGLINEVLNRNINPVKYDDCIAIPNTLYGVVGHTLGIYTDNITNYLSKDIIVTYEWSGNSDLSIRDNAKIMNEGIFITPTKSGNYKISIVFKNVKNKELYRKTIDFLVCDANTSINKKGIIIGDSNTERLTYINELYNLFESDDSSSLTLIGTRGTSPKLHEGRSGWQCYHYTHNYEYNNRQNSFWNNETNKFDFSYYLQNNNLDTPDFVSIQLGTNDIYGYTPELYIVNLWTIINSIKSTNSNIRIYIALVTPPAYTQDAFGVTNYANTTRKQFKDKQFEYVKNTIKTFDNKNNIKVIPTHVNLDCENNFPQETTPKSRTCATEKTKIIDQLHFTQEGGNQVADTYYYFLKNQ